MQIEQFDTGLKNKKNIEQNTGRRRLKIFQLKKTSGTEICFTSRISAKF